MPPIVIAPEVLAPFGETWTANGGSLSRTPPHSSGQLGNLLDSTVGQALATMLGNIPIATPSAASLVPAQPNCVEVGPVRIVGGIRSQNFDVGYRPDGVRFAFDSKTLNDEKSIRKNWQNMINDLATEATTVHSRFPHAIVAFIVALPFPALGNIQRSAITEILERLSRRKEVNDPLYLAEAVSLVLWEPTTGEINSQWPDPDSPIRIERFSEKVEAAYITRYKGMPPHVAD